MSEEISKNTPEQEVQNKNRSGLLSELLQKEGKLLLVILVLLFLALKIVFFRESFLSTLRITLSLFGMFVLTGWALTYYWREKLSFFERIIVGVAISSAVLGIVSYYAGLLGWPPRYQGYVLPVLLFAGGILYFISFTKEKSDSEK